MQPTIVMLIALGGLGCQNPASDLPPLPSVAANPVVETPPAAEAPAYVPAPTPYPVYATNPVLTGDIPEDDSFRGCLRDTFCSFFLGRDPDVPTARQIMSAYQAGGYGR
jgi:hypothetical protein